MAQRPNFRSLWLLAALAGLTGCADQPMQAGLDGGGGAAVNPQALVGSTPQMLAAEFGRPVLRRVDGPAQVWVYQSAVCGLQVFLYPDAAGTPRVAAAVPDNGNAAGCMQSLTRPGLTSAALERPPAS